MEPQHIQRACELQGSEGMCGQVCTDALHLFTVYLSHSSMLVAYY